MPSIREGLNKGHLSKYTYKEKGKDTRDFEKNVLMYIYRLKYPGWLWRLKIFWGPSVYTGLNALGMNLVTESRTFVCSFNAYKAFDIPARADPNSLSWRLPETRCRRWWGWSGCWSKACCGGSSSGTGWTSHTTPNLYIKSSRREEEEEEVVWHISRFKSTANLFNFSLSLSLLQKRPLM